MRASGDVHNHTHAISGRVSRRTSCAFAACVVAWDLFTVVCLFCVAVGFVGFVFVDSVMVCTLHSVRFPPNSVLCSGQNPDITVMSASPCCPALFCSVLFCFVCCVMSCSAYVLSILSFFGLICFGRVVLVYSALSFYSMMRASPTLSFLFSVLVCVVHVVLLSV